MLDEKIERYINSLDRDLIKRKKEIVSLKQMIGLANDEEHINFLTRSTLVILYAHWEGYTKYAFRKFLTIFKDEKNLAVPLLSIYLTGYTRKIQLTTHDPSTNRKIIDFLQQPHNISDIEVEKTFDFESNVNSKVLRKMLSVCNQELRSDKTRDEYQEGIINKVKEFETKMNKLDELLNLRNAIAHGELRPVKTDEAHTFIEIMLQMLEDIKEIFIDTVLSYFPVRNEDPLV